MLKMETAYVFKKAGHDIPLAYLSELLKEGVSALTVAGLKNGKFHARAAEIMPTAEEFNTNMTPTIKDIDALIFTARSNEEVPPEEYQPFITLTNTDDEPILRTLLKGTFHEGKDSKVMIPMSKAHEILQEKIKDLYDTCDDDLDKLMALLDKPSIRRDIEGMYGVLGAVFLLGSNGKFVRISSAGKEYDWGYVTDTFGYAAEKKEEKTEKPQKGAFALFGAGEEEDTSKSELPEKVPTETSDKKSSVVDKGLTVGDVNAQTDTSVPLMVRVPDRLWNEKDTKKRKNIVKGWYQKYFGHANGWEKRPSFPITQLKKTLEGQDAVDSIVKPTAAEVAEKTGAATEVKEVDQYTFSAKAVEEIGEFLKGLDHEKRAVSDPKELHAKEEKYPTFSQRMGIQLSDVHYWSLDDFETLGIKSLEGLAHLAMELRTKNYELEQLLGQDTKLKDLVNTGKKEEEKIPVGNEEFSKQPEPEKKVAAGGGAFSMFR